MTALRRLAALRGLTMASYSMCYVVIPTLVFDRTRSAAAAGIALMVEGVLRALLATLAGRLRSRVGAARVVHVAEASKLLALGLLGWATWRFSLPVVVAASVLYQLGYSLSLLEQELRCGALGPAVTRGQSSFRMAEMLAVPPVLVVALIGQAQGVGQQALLVASAVACCVHHRLWHRWMSPMSGGEQVLDWGKLVHASRYMATQPRMIGGLAASLVGYGFFAWMLLATPFAFEGRQLFGLEMSSAAGNSIFKACAAAACLLGTLAWTRVLAMPAAHGIMIAVSGAIPVLGWVALCVPGDGWAVLAGCVLAAMATGLSSWQRAWRLTQTPASLRQGVTALYLAAECLGLVCTGAALLTQDPIVACGGLMLGMLWGLWRFASGPAARAHAVRKFSNPGL